VTRTKIGQAAKAALARIEIAKSRIHALHYVMQGIRESRYGETPELREDFSRLHSFLYRELNDAYATLFLWGVVDPATLREARKAAFEHYLREGASIMQYLDMRGKHPGMWSADEEKEFRAEIEAAKKAEP